MQLPRLQYATGAFHMNTQYSDQNTHGVPVIQLLSPARG